MYKIERNGAQLMNSISAHTSLPEINIDLRSQKPVQTATDTNPSIINDQVSIGVDRSEKPVQTAADTNPSITNDHTSVAVDRSEKSVQTAADTNPSIANDHTSVAVDRAGQQSQQVDYGVHKKWTFLHYGAADNNLSSFIRDDVDEQESIGSDQNTHLISQLDLPSGCKRYYLTQGPQDHKISSPVVDNLGNFNMADPKSLTDFIVWGTKNFPSDHLAVMLGSHGGGTMGAVADDGSHAFMSPQQIKQAFADAEKITGKKVDILGFDCCLMANTEVAYELKDVADYIVASEESEGGNGWPYTAVLSEKVLSKLQEALASKISIDPKAFAEKIIADTGTVQQDLPTMSTVDTSKMDNVAQTLNGLANAILANDTDKKSLLDITRKTESFSDFKDTYHFCEQIVNSKTITDEKMKAEAKKVMQALDDAIIANQHSHRYPNAHGLHMEIPKYGTMSSGYQNLQFAKDTNWDEAMHHMGTNH